MKTLNLDQVTLDQAVSGQMSSGDLEQLIASLENELNDLLPVANREFANAATEAFDLSQRWSSSQLNQALQAMLEAQSDLNGLLSVADITSLGDVALMAQLELPSPEMLFSDPASVPLFIDWQTASAESFNDVDLHIGQRGISTSGDLYGATLGMNDRFDLS